MIPTGLFVTATGTGVGKTWVTRGVARAAFRAGRRFPAVKPIETGCAPDPLDAVALARACGRPALAHADGLYRARPSLSPYAASLEGDPPVPSLDALVRACAALAADADGVLVEGAGGLLVPLDATRTIADLARALALPLLVVAEDTLGVLSHVLTACESARARSLRLAGVVLTQREASRDDASTRTNRRILAERLDAPVFSFPACRDDDDALADAADRAGLVRLLD